MAKKKKIDGQDIVNILTKGGFQVTSIEWVGDPEKQEEIFVSLGEAIAEIAGRGLPTEEMQRLVSERTKEAMKELVAAGIKCETSPAFGISPLQPDAD
jgi:DNA-binding transcriptional regulator YhcF (GntR family)